MPERKIWIIDVGRLCDVLPKDLDEKIGNRLGSNPARRRTELMR